MFVREERGYSESKLLSCMEHMMVRHSQLSDEGKDRITGEFSPVKEKMAERREMRSKHDEKMGERKVKQDELDIETEKQRHQFRKSMTNIQKEFENDRRKSMTIERRGSGMVPLAALLDQEGIRDELDTSPDPVKNIGNNKPFSSPTETETNGKEVEDDELESLGIFERQQKQQQQQEEEEEKEKKVEGEGESHVQFNVESGSKEQDKDTSEDEETKGDEEDDNNDTLSSTLSSSSSSSSSVQPPPPSHKHKRPVSIAFDISPVSEEEVVAVHYEFNASEGEEGGVTNFIEKKGVLMKRGTGTAFMGRKPWTQRFFN